MGPGPDPDPDPPTPGRPALLQVAAGDAQSGVVGKELAQVVVIRVSDVNATAVPQQIVNWVVVSGGGSVFAGTGLTNAEGEARERWTLGPSAGEQVLEARAVDATTGEAIVFTRITASAFPGEPVTLSLSSAEHRMFLGERLDVATLVASAVDEFGNAVSAPTLAITAPAPFETAGTTVSSASEGEGEVTLASGSATASVKVLILRNLAELVGGKGSYACIGKKDGVIGDDESVPRYESEFIVDSMIYTAGVDDGSGVLWVTETVTMTGEDRATQVLPPAQAEIPVGGQLPYRFFLSFGTGPGNHAEDWARQVRPSEEPLIYEGLSYCRTQRDYETYEPFKIVKAK